jgi:hypothetical protein
MEPELEKNLITQSIRSGMPLPDKIKNAPVLLLGLDFFFKTWVELGSCRSVGMDEGPIPWTVIRTYCNEYDILGELREDTFYLVRSIDNAYLRWKKDKAKKQRLSEQAGKKKRGNK